jgi:hypothetical protein
MAENPNEMVEAIVAGMPEKTGKSGKQWVEILKKSGPSGYKAQVDWLKQEYGLGHMQANIVAQMLKNGGDLYEDGDKLVAALFSGKNAALRPVYDTLAGVIIGLGDDVKLQPAQTMIPYYRNKKFVEIRPVGGALEVGMAIPDMPPRKDKRGELQRINVIRTIKAMGEIEAIQEELKRAYEQN